MHISIVKLKEAFFIFSFHNYFLILHEQLHMDAKIRAQKKGWAMPNLLIIFISD